MHVSVTDLILKIVESLDSHPSIDHEPHPHFKHIHSTKGGRLLIQPNYFGGDGWKSSIQFNISARVNNLLKNEVSVLIVGNITNTFMHRSL